MKTGFAKKCITPPLGTPIVGYYNQRLTQGVHDDLFVRCIAFDDGEKKALCIALDLCLLSTERYNEYKEMLFADTQIPADAIFITCSHTHTGPLTGKDFASDLCVSDEYLNILKMNIRDAALYALKDLKESEFFEAETKAEGVSFCRRYRMKDGTTRTNPGVGNPDIDYALAQPNETVKLLKIVREGAKDIYVVNFGTHPDSVGGDLISADYPGYVCSTLENALGDINCVFLQGPQGDVNHINPNPSEGEKVISVIDFDSVPRGIEHAKHMGRIIAGAVLSVCTVATPIESGKIRFNSRILDLPTHQENDKLESAREICKLYDEGRTEELPFKEMELTTEVARARRIVALENGPYSIPLQISAISFGSFVFGGFAGEPFTEIGNRVCEASPFATTILCCLTNSSGSYVPTTKAYAEGGYEAATSRLKPGADDMLVEGMLELLKTV